MPEYSDDSLDLGVGVDIQPETQQAPVNDENPFEKEKFDAGVDVDEEQDPKKYIERLTGKLAQKLRSYNEQDVDIELNKFVINSLVPAAIPAMPESDANDVVKKVQDNIGQESGQIQEPTNDEVPENQPEQGLESGQEPAQEPMQDEQPPVKQEEKRDSEIEDLISEILGSKKLSRGIKNKTPFKAPKFK